MMTVLDHALRLARRGLAVFPCHDDPGTDRDKTPVHRGGFHNATCDPEDVELWIWEGRLIGVATGPISGIAVLDIDPRNGGDDWLKANLRRLPYTRSHRTRHRGVHLLFRVSDDELRCSAGQIAPGVDVRAHLGSAIWWPAHPPNGMVLDHMPLNRLPPWPEWLVPEKKTNPLRHGGGGDWYAAASPNRINGLIERVRNEPEGNRNDLLFWAACCIGGIRFERDTQRGRTLDRLLDAAIAAGLDPSSAAATIESGLRPERRRRSA